MKPLRLATTALTQPEWLIRARRTGGQHWQRLAPRERRLVLLAATVAGLALVWLLFLQPALDTTARLSSALPQLRAQAAQLDVVLEEARELQRQAGTGAAIPAARMPEELASSLARAGLADNARVSAASSTTWRIELERAPVEPLLQWLQGLAFELRAQPMEIALERSAGDDGKPMSGRVSGSLLLSSARAGRS